MGFREKDIADPLNSQFLGRGNELIGSGSITRFQSAFLFDSYFILKAVKQGVSDRVLSPDLFASGDIGTVRGFPLSEVMGDNAYLLSAEYVIPVPINFSFTQNGPTFKQLFSIFGFIDHSRVYVKNPQPGEHDMKVSGAGGGVRLNIPKIENDYLDVNFTFAVGIPVLDSPLTSDGRDLTFYYGGQVQF